MERCLPAAAQPRDEANGERSNIGRNGLVAHLHSKSFEELNPQNRRAMLQSVEIERDIPRDFPLLNIGLASEAALHRLHGARFRQ